MDERVFLSPAGEHEEGREWKSKESMRNIRILSSGKMVKDKIVENREPGTGVLIFGLT